MASLQLPADVETWPAQRVVEFVLGEFPGRVALACSFQKEETVLLDMLFELEPKARVFAIDTHHLFPETYELWHEVERRYDTKIERLRRRAGRGRALGEESRPLPRDREARAAQPRAARPRRLDHRHPPRPVADARRRAEARLGLPARALEGEPARRLDATTTAGRTSASAACRTTRSTTRATTRSATRIRRCPARAARAAGPGPSGPSAGCTHESAASSSGSRASRARARRRSRTTSSRSSSGAASSSTTSTATSSAPTSRGPRLLEGGPRHEHRPHRLGRVAPRARRRGRDRLGDLAVRGDAAARAHARRAARAVRRDPRRDAARGVRAPRPEGPLRGRVRRRDRGVHRRLCAVRGAARARAAPRHVRPHAHRVGRRRARPPRRAQPAAQAVRSEAES